MIDKQTGPTQVRPNTLQGQSAPNTFRSQTGSETASKQYLNSGGGNAAPPRRLAIPQLPIGAFVVLVIVVIFVALYLLSGTL